MTTKEQVARADSPGAGQPSPSLPAGTVTFLFTDIEGSTQLLQRLRDRYATLLADHHRLLRETFSRWHGQEVDTQGDAFFVAFPRATDAIAAVVEAQRAVANHQWPDDVQVRVRMGLHTGEPWLVNQGYVGMDVHRAARIAHAGHGGQFSAHPGGVNWLAWSPDGQRIASASDVGEAKLWDAVTGELLSYLYSGYPSAPVEAPSWSPDGTLVAVYNGEDSMITIWDPIAGRPGRPLHAIPTSGTRMIRINWFPNQERLLTSD